MDVSICTPTYQAQNEPNLATMGAALPAAVGDGLTYELVVALNGLTAEAAGVPDGARTVRLEHNMGVAPGWNAAAQAAAGDVLVFANDDVVLGPGSVARLHEALEQYPHAGVVGPVGSMWDRRRWRHSETIKPSGHEAIECDAISGFLFAVRREDFDAVGGFDEAYAPASWEEIDFNMAQQARGKKSLAVGGASVSHSWGISARQVPWARISWGGRRESLRAIHRRNRAHFLSKWA